MKRILSLLMLLALLLTSSALASCTPQEQPPEVETPPTPEVDPINDNYRTFYQIFVGSFADSNGDGIGDLRGIINRFDYLNDGNIHSGKSLGVQGIWLSPIFTSPTYHKYDAKDYYKVDWRFGDESTLKELIALCHERNVKIILDLAINHTSDQHEWFLQFKQARINGDVSNPYYDYYSCATTAEKQNGISYGKLAGVDCWYECNFSGGMPELNYDNPEVREAMLDVAKYYLDLGIDGFRFDAVKYIYFGDTARSVDFWEWYMSELRAIKPDIYCVGECWSGDSEVLEYYPAMNCFNFTMSQAEGILATAAKGKNIATYTNYVQSYQKSVKVKNPDGMIMPFLSNHDMDRIAGAFITDNYSRMAANLYLLCSGSPVIYYGEEIGMRGSRGSENTDANRRLAMLWGDGSILRDPEGATYPASKQITTTVADQMADENSLYNYYCKVIAVRHKYPAIARGDYTALACGNKNLGGFRIDYQDEVWGIIHNTSSQPLSVDLATCKALDGHAFAKICEAVGAGNATLEGTVLTLDAYTSVVLQ